MMKRISELQEFIKPRLIDSPTGYASSADSSLRMTIRPPLKSPSNTFVTIRNVISEDNIAKAYNA